MSGTQFILHRAGRRLQAADSMPKVALPGLLAMLLLLVLSGCDTLPSQAGSSDTRYLETRAKRLARAGYHEQAAELFEQLASEAALPDRFLLSAAREWYAAENWRDTLRNLNQITGPLDQDAAIEQSLLGTSSALYAGDVMAAERWLSLLPESPPDDARPAILWVRTRMALARGEFARAFELNEERELWLASSEEVRAGRHALLEALQARNRDEGLPQAQDPEDSRTSGWLKLATILAGADRDPFVVRSALGDWQEAYSDHPAALLLPDLMENFRRLLDYPRRVAVLLPLSGRLQAAGNAVRDGLVAAYLRHQGERPIIRFYDVEAEEISEMYGRAILDGAEFVIGPLTRDGVARLGQLEELPVPVLALNNLPAEQPARHAMFQFGLTPEDEARQAALRIVEDGFVQGVAMIPDSEWGRRMLSAFTVELETAGGIVLDYQQYPANEEDFSASITTVLHLAESNARHRALSGVLGRRIEFEPRRRKDVQFIFLAANARAGRLMRPQLRFHYATRLPVYATSAVYEPQPERNADLNGVIFNDIPWTIDDQPEIMALRDQFTQIWPRGMRAWPRLYALGFDAYRLVPPLFSGQLLEGQNIQGLTGDLSLAGGGRLQRQLLWARFEGGLPVLLGAPGTLVEEKEPDPAP